MNSNTEKNSFLLNSANLDTQKYIPNLEFPEETYTAIAELKIILQEINMQMKKEGYRLIDGILTKQQA